jgi:isoleucyl-tRNA synthetase
VPEELKENLSGAAVAIWTTTGWTIPANEAVAVNECMKYVLVEAQASVYSPPPMMKILITVVITRSAAQSQRP